MPQGSIHYAIGRLSVLEKDALDPVRLERLIQAPSVPEAMRILTEFGWPESRDVEEGAREHLARACRLVRELSTDPRVTDAYLYRYDARNLKTLLKARCLGEEPGTLSRCGALAPEVLRRAVADRNYRPLPRAFRAALEELEKRLAVRPDPMDIDVTLDKARFAAAFEALPPGKGEALVYFKTRVDLLNGLMALRSAHGGRSPAFLAGLIIPGGTVAPAVWEKTYRRPERLPLLLRPYGTRVYAAAVAAYVEPGKLPLLEREAEDSLTALYRPYGKAIGREERLYAHLLIREREAEAVRLVMTAKANRFPPEAIRERLRALYGG